MNNNKLYLPLTTDSVLSVDAENSVAARNNASYSTSASMPQWSRMRSYAFLQD